MAVTDDLPLTLGRNLLSFTYESDLTERASRIAPTSQALGGVPTVLGFARWRITAPNSGAKTFINEDPAGGVGAIGFDDQFENWYVLLERTGESFRITDTDATTQTFTLATWSASLVAGAMVQLRRTAPGTIHSAFSYRTSAAPQSVPIMDAEVFALAGAVITVRDGWLSGSTPPVASDNQHVGRSVRLSEFLATDEITDFAVDLSSGVAVYTYTFADVSGYQVGDWLRRTADVFPGFAYGDIDTRISNAFAAAMTIVAVNSGAHTVTVVSRDGGTSLNRVIYDTAQFGAGYNDVRVYRPLADLRTVTASSGSAHTLTLDSVAGFSIGAGPGAVEILVETTSTSGKVPWYLEHPLYVQPPPVGIGVQVRTIDRSTLIGVATLNDNAVMRTWTTPTSMPDGWLGGAGLNAVSGTPTAFNIAQNTNPLFTRVGGKSLFFSGVSGVITTAPIPWTPAYDGQALSLRLSLILTQWVPNGTIFVQFGILRADGVILPWWSQPRSELLKPPGSTLATPPFKEFVPNVWDDVVLNDFDITEPSDYPVNLRPNASDIADMAAAQGIVAVIQFNGGGTKLEGYLDGAMITVSHEAPADVREFGDANRLHQDTNAALAELGPPQATIAVDFFDAKRMNPSLDEPDAAKGVVADVDVPSLGIDHVRRRITDVVRNVNVPGDTRITIGKKTRRLADAVAKAPATKPPPVSGGTPSGGAPAPQSVPAPALTIVLDGALVPTVTAVLDPRVTRIKFAWSVTGVPSAAITRAAASIVVVSGTPASVTLPAIAEGATIYVAALAYDAATTESAQGSAQATAGFLDTPADLANLLIWYRSDREQYTDSLKTTPAAADGDAVFVRGDLSGNGHDAVRAGTGGNGARLRLNAVNAHPALEYSEPRNDHYDLPDVLSALTEGEVFIVVKAGEDPAASFGDNGSMMNFGNSGDGATLYPFTDGHIRDDFGSTVRYDVGNPTPDLSTAYRIYNVYSALNDWQAFLDGVSLHRETVNTVSFSTAPRLGAAENGGISWNGREPEFLFYSHKLSDDDRAATTRYLAHRYNAAISTVFSALPTLSFARSGGDVIVTATAPHADSVKLAASLVGVPSDTDVRAATALTVRPFTMTFAAPAVGATLHVAAFGYLGTDESTKVTLDIVGSASGSGGSDGPGSDAPSGVEFVVGVADVSLPNARVVTDSPTIAWDLTTPGELHARVVASPGVPTRIAADETFTVPADRQVLIALPIDVEGTLVVEGSLIMVD